MPKKTKAKKQKPIFDKDVENNRLMASLSYLWILCLVPLLLARKSKFAQFHAKQGLLLFAVEIVGSLVFWIPFFGWILWLSIVIVAVIGFAKVMQGEYWEIPVLGEYAHKLDI